MDRIKQLCGYLENCKKFADVGCDHGYCTEYMLKNKLCESAVISDISAKSLSKAEELLKGYIACGKVRSVCCYGLEKIEEDCDQILIAGMGGEEITEILKFAYIPRLFVFQPMKNVKKLREYLIECGAQITVDEPFYDGKKYYFVIKGRRGNGGAGTEYSAAELEFGKNLKSALTKAYMRTELTKKKSYALRNLGVKAREKIESEIKFIQETLKNES